MTYEILTDLRWNAKDLSGQSFVRLTAIAPVDRDKRSGIKWLCICECGSDLTILTGSLVSGNTKSCGCLQRGEARIAHTTHGMSETPEYRLWCAMMQRVSNPNNKAYKNYGGRGIGVCKKWRKFKNFIADMGKKPTPKHTLDRINNNGNYSPDNCRWATQVEQHRNKRTNRMVTHNGQTLCLAEWAEKTGINYQTLRGRLNRGLPVDGMFAR